MSEACERLHEAAAGGRRHRFPLEGDRIPADGIYLVFEDGERAHGGDRIVGVGTHRATGQLPGRLAEHYLNENKDRSIFRKNIGRALLARDSDPFLESWNLDLTSRANRDRYAASIDLNRQAEIEREVSKYIQRAFSFVVLQVPDREERLALKMELIGTLVACSQCGPSGGWLGNHSPKAKIRDLGLWQEQGFATPALEPVDVERIAADFVPR
jgi:hypothetical protein